jgi:site-specific DNA recombinase
MTILSGPHFHNEAAAIIGSFAEIAEREAQGERHIRLLAPLAFLSPRIIAAIVAGLAKALPYSWAEQEERVGLSL